MYHKPQEQTFKPDYRNTGSFYQREQRGHMLRALIFVMLGILLVLVCYVVANRDVIINNYKILYSENAVRALQFRTVEMYSLTECENCRIMAKQFRDKGIPFTEYFLNQDAARKLELDKRLRQKNAAGKTVAAPVIFVNNEVFFGKLPLESLLQPGMQ